jgi:hypothetical protein
MLPEGQRKWKYYRIYALSNLDLQPDDVFKIKGVSYRVLEKTDWSKFGYFIYDTIEDYNLNAPDESNSD